MFVVIKEGIVCELRGLTALMRFQIEKDNIELKCDKIQKKTTEKNITTQVRI
jgi:hypothetical protein